MQNFSKAVLIPLITVNLFACANPMVSNNTPAQPKPSASTQTPIATPKYTSSSYVLAEPLPNKKLKISITAKDKTLYIINCNEDIPVSLYESKTRKYVWGGITNDCLSRPIIIPKLATLSFEFPIRYEDKQLDFTTNHIAGVGSIYDNPDFSKSKPVAKEKVISNEFKLIP